LLGEFLREVREIAMVNKRREERAKARGEAEQAEQDRKTNNEKERLPDILMSPAEKGPFLDHGDEDDGSAVVLDRAAPRRDVGEGTDERDTGGQCSRPLCTSALQTFFAVWTPGQGVKVDFAAMVEILIQQLDGTRALRNSFGSFDANFFGQMMRSSNQPPSNGFTNSYTLLKM
jgi:vacuole morphology and inheritance protein 14